jgi:hypothetical protein
MPTYSTPFPIDVAVNLQVGALDVVASDRSDAVVTVAPTNPDRAVDRRGAEETTVEFDGSRLTVKGPRPRLAILGPAESVDIRVELPTGSRLTAELSVGPVRTAGRLGATRIKCSMGAVDLDSVGDLWLRAGHGDIRIGTAAGAAEVTADHGQLRIGAVAGDASLKASHGSIGIDETAGDVQAKLSYGGLEIDRALGSVTARTAYGSIALREVSRGSIQLESGFGQITLAVRPGVPAWLDLASKTGHVRNRLDSDRAPGGSEQAVAVRARTDFGDIEIHRAR